MNTVISHVCPSVCPSICSHPDLSTSTGRNLLILDMMEYGLGMRRSVIPHALTKMSVSENCSSVKRYTAGCSASIRLHALFTHVAHYITLVLAAHKGQKGQFKKCFILVLVYMHDD